MDIGHTFYLVKNLKIKRRDLGLHNWSPSHGIFWCPKYRFDLLSLFDVEPCQMPFFLLPPGLRRTEVNITNNRQRIYHLWKDLNWSDWGITIIEIKVINIFVDLSLGEHCILRKIICKTFIHFVYHRLVFVRLVVSSWYHRLVQQHSCSAILISQVLQREYALPINDCLILIICAAHNH